MLLFDLCKCLGMQIPLTLTRPRGTLHERLPRSDFQPLGVWQFSECYFCFPIGVFRCLVIFGDGDAEACPKDLFEQPKESNFASPDSSSQCLSDLVLQLWLCVCDFRCQFSMHFCMASLCRWMSTGKLLFFQLCLLTTPTLFWLRKAGHPSQLPIGTSWCKLSI